MVSRSFIELSKQEGMRATIAHGDTGLVPQLTEPTKNAAQGSSLGGVGRSSCAGLGSYGTIRPCLYPGVESKTLRWVAEVASSNFCSQGAVVLMHYGPAFRGRPLESHNDLFCAAWSSYSFSV